MIHFVCYPKKKIETFVDVAKIKIPNTIITVAEKNGDSLFSKAAFNESLIGPEILSGKESDCDIFFILLFIAEAAVNELLLGMGLLESLLITLILLEETIDYDNKN